MRCSSTSFSTPSYPSSFLQASSSSPCASMLIFFFPRFCLSSLSAVQVLSRPVLRTDVDDGSVDCKTTSTSFRFLLVKLSSPRMSR